MKSLYMLKTMAFVMVLTFWACSDDIDNPNNTNRNASGTSNRFSASVGMPGATQESLKSAQTSTKVNLVNNTSNRNLLYETWADGDQIALFFINDDGTIIAGEKVTISNISSDRKSCYFEGEIPEGVSTTFTLVGVVGMDDVKVNHDGTKIVASAEPRPFKANNDDDKIPMMFKNENITRAPSGTTTIQALFERVGSIEHVYFQNKSGAATSIQNVEMVPVKAGAPAWYYTATQSKVPQVDLLTGDVATVPGTPKTSATTATYVRSGATQSFIKWVMPTKEIEGKQKPEVKIELTTSSGKITSFNTNKIPGYSYNIKVQKQRIYTEVAQLYRDGKLAFTHPYIIQTDGGTSAGTAIAALKNQSGVKHMELGNNTHAFTGLTVSRWFDGLTKVISYGSEITRLNYQNSTKFDIEAQLTPRITSLSTTFRNAKSDTYPGIEKWDTQYVTDMSGMFQRASNFNQPLNNWKTDSVKNMNGMFQNASNFNQPLDNWKTYNVISMSSMFQRASNFNQPLNNWKTPKVKDMRSMFSYATKFNQDLSSWEVSEVTNMGYMFQSATSFNQDISKWDVSNVTNMHSMFWEVKNFNNGAEPGTANNPLNWGEKTKRVKYMQYMFYKVEAFNQDISTWVVDSVKNMSYMFSGATKFNQDISSWSARNVTDMSSMFAGAESFNQDISKWRVDSVTNMRAMFSGAGNFNNGGKSLNWGEKTKKVGNMDWMFRNATAFNQNISGWDVTRVKTMNEMFRGASAFNQDIGNWKVDSVTNMSYMFFEASIFNQDISEWNVSSVTNMERMFDGASAFNNGGKPLNWGKKTGNVTNMGRMFTRATAFNQDISGWCVSKITAEPQAFAASSGIQLKPQYHPQWGTCP